MFNNKKNKNTEEDLLILNNQQIDSELKIAFKLDDKDFEFPIKVLDKDEEYIYTSVIRIENKVLNFANSKVKINLILSLSDKRPIIWENIQMQTFLHPKKKQTVYIIPNRQGKFFNRRGNFRIPLSIEADAQIGLHNSVERVIIRDVSSTGISVVVDKKTERKKSDIVHIVFYDPLVKKKIDITSYIVRTQELENGNILYGCKFKKESEGMLKYIQERQRLDLQRMSGKIK